MLESILRHNVIRYISLATALTLSAPVYAQTSASEDNATEQHAVPPADNRGAYYIDPAKKKKRRVEEKPPYLQSEPAADSSSPSPTPINNSPAPSYLQNQESRPRHAQSTPAPSYLQSSPPASAETGGGKGWAWAALIGGLAGVAIGTQLENEMCFYGPGESNDCKTDNSLKYATMGAGALMAGLGLWGLLK